MNIDWILGVGTVVFIVTSWATLNFGYAYFRDLGQRDEAATSTPDPAEPAPVPAAAASDGPAPAVPGASGRG